VALSILIKMFLDHLLRELLFGGTPGHYGRVQQIKFLRIKIRMSSKNSPPFIVMKNLSNHDVDCTPNYINGWNMAFEYLIRDANGNVVESWEKKHPGVGRTFSPMVSRSLKPGETLESVETISTHYDMIQPGEYTVQVSRRVSNNAKDGVVKSNKITITVNPKPKGPPPPQQ
jgi:hypothetical protein